MDESKGHLDKVAEALKALEQEDSSSPQLKSLTQRYERQLKELERRSHASGGPTPAPGSAERPQKDAAGGKPKALPRAVRLQVQPVQQKLRSVESLIGNLEYAKEGRASKTPAQIIADMDVRLKEAEEACTSFVSEAEKAGCGEHPDVLQVKQQMDDVKAKAARAKASGEAFTQKKAAHEGAVAQDCETLKQEVQRLEPVISKASGTPAYYNDMKPAEELIIIIEQFEKNDQDRVKKLVAAMTAKYGSNGSEVESKTDSRELWYPLEKLILCLQNVPKTRTVMAEDLAKRTQEMLEGLPRLHDFSRMERHAVVRQWALMAKRFDAENAAVQSLLASLEPKLDADSKKLEQKIDAAVWPGHAANAPEDASALAAAAHAWLKSDTGWGSMAKNPETPIAVVVTGPWSVQKTSLTGEPIMYGLPVKAALQRAEDKEKGIARVFVLTMRTQERAGVKQTPPFDSVTVGDSYFIRAGAVK